MPMVWGACGLPSTRGAAWLAVGWLGLGPCWVSRVIATAATVAPTAVGSTTVTTRRRVLLSAVWVAKTGAPSGSGGRLAGVFDRVWRPWYLACVPLSAAGLGWGTGSSAAAGASHSVLDSCHSCCDLCHGERPASDSGPAALGSKPGPPGLPCSARVKLSVSFAGSPDASCGSTAEPKS